MKQETVCAIPGELFAVSDAGASSSKGACVCAVVVLPSRPAKYTLVCYNAQQVTYCVARMSWVDGQNTSLRLIVSAAGHVAFSDDANQRWSLFFAEEAQQVRFLACVGAAFYTLYGAPATHVFYQDLTLPSSSLQLTAADRAAVRFTAFELVDRDGVYTVGTQTEQRGGSGNASAAADTAALAYVFSPRVGTAQLAQGCFGFESSVVGMREDDQRVFVVPPGYTTRVSEALTEVSTQGHIFVVQLLRVEHGKGEAEDTVRGPGGAPAASPPAVYAATEEEEASPHRAAAAVSVAAPSSQALALVPQQTAAALQGPSTSSSVPAYLSPSGIPAEHMSVLRKVELGVNAAVTSARDVHDVTAIFTQEWHRHIERPKPSLLSNRALLEQVQRVVLEEETAQTSLDDCDRAVQALEARNKELQQRIDRATIESQKLLEQKSSAAATAMDARLDRDRHLVRLKDTLLLKRQEHEDLQRHIAALQRTVDVANEELRQVRGKRDIHQVEATSMADRLSAMQETLSEERRRNAALAAKKAATEESIRKALAQQRVAEGQLTTVRGLAEKERLRYIEMMEEERHHRAQDSELLRQDIVHELDARERQFQVDRQRLAEEQFMRGLRDGKGEGRQAAEADLLGHQDELRLNLQRAKTEVETSKEEVRRTIEAAMALRRTLGAKVTDMEEQLSAASQKQARLQFQLAQWQTRCRTVRDTVSQHWRTLISHATHPCTREELLRMIEAVRAAEDNSYKEDEDGEGGPVRVDLQFQVELWKQSRSRSIEQRVEWLSDDMVGMYVKGAEYHYEHEYLQPIAAAHTDTLEFIAQLYAQLHGSRKLFDLCVQEARERWSQQQQWWVTIKSIEDWLAAQRTAQEELKAEEAEHRQALWKTFIDGGDAIVQLCAAQLREQVFLIQNEMESRDELRSEEERAREQLPSNAQQMWAADCAAALRLFEEEEEAARAGLEAEAYTASSGLQFQLAYAKRAAEEASLQHAAQQQLLAEETGTRLVLAGEASSVLTRLRGEAMAALQPPPPPAPLPPPVPEQAPLNEEAQQTMHHLHAAAEPAEATDLLRAAGPSSEQGTAAGAEQPPASTSDGAVAPPLPHKQLHDTPPMAELTEPPHNGPAEPLPSGTMPDVTPFGAAPPLMSDEQRAAPLSFGNGEAPPLPPPSTASATPAFNFTDLPRVNTQIDNTSPHFALWSTEGARAGVPAAAGTNATTDGAEEGDQGAHLLFSEEPPPLPPPDADDNTDEAAHGPVTAREDRKRGTPAAAEAPPPRPPRAPSKRAENATDVSHASGATPPPLPSSDADENATRSSSSTSLDSDSSASSSPVSPPPARDGAAAAPSHANAHHRAAPVPPTLVASIEGSDEEGEERQPSRAAQKPRHLFGGSSNDSDDELGEAAAAAGRNGGASASRKPPSAVAAVQKPRLFDSSGSDGE